MILQGNIKDSIPEKLSLKLQREGVKFEKLQESCTSIENLLQLIYSQWRSGNIRVERNWNNVLDQPLNVPYSNSACLLPDDNIVLKLPKETQFLKIATWNVNSIRTRLPTLLNWLTENNPQIVCIQETKVEDSLFPIWDLKQVGYESIYYGQKSYNGVAILSKMPMDDIQYGFINTVSYTHLTLPTKRIV